MTALQLPAPGAPASEWGRLAALIPGWRAPDTALPSFWFAAVDLFAPDPDHWAWGGWMLLMLSLAGVSMHFDSDDGSARVEWWHPDDLEGDPLVFEAPTIGRVCIMVAAHIGRWPGGEE